MISQLMKLDAQECSKIRCSGNGHCVEMNGETMCECSLAYRGDSCQDNLLKGPLFYGPAALCTGLVVIIVMAVVAKRRKGVNTRFVKLLTWRNLFKDKYTKFRLVFCISHKSP